MTKTMIVVTEDKLINMITIMITKDKLINWSKRKRNAGGEERQVRGEMKSLERKERARRKLRKKKRKEGKRIG